jgi:hypothetical protein
MPLACALRSAWRVRTAAHPWRAPRLAPRRAPRCRRCRTSAAPDACSEPPPVARSTCRCRSASPACQRCPAPPSAPPHCSRPRRPCRPVRAPSPITARGAATRRLSPLSREATCHAQRGRNGLVDECAVPKVSYSALARGAESPEMPTELAKRAACDRAGRSGSCADNSGGRHPRPAGRGACRKRSGARSRVRPCPGWTTGVRRSARRFEQERAQLLGQMAQLAAVQAAQVVRTGDAF